MKRVRPNAVLLVWALVVQSAPKVGDTNAITRTSEMSSQGDNGSSGSSFDRDTLIERVVAVRDAGVELEYDLPDATAEDRARQWQFPVRVLKPRQGPMRLLNGAELETRVESWLRAAELPRTACGRWIFTWNAFRIECDPQSVIGTLEAFDLQPDELRDGALFHDPAAREPAPMTETRGPIGATFVVEMAVDPDVARRGRAESNVVVAEISHEALTFEQALRRESATAISGSITVTFEAGPDGSVRRRTKVTELDIAEPGGQKEHRAVTETTERRAVSATLPSPDTI